MRGWGFRRWRAACGLAVVAVVATACPPEVEPPASPYGCGADLVAVGAGHPLDLSDDGNVLLTFEYVEESPDVPIGYRYHVLDRRRGTLRLVAESDSYWEPYEMWVDAAGTRVVLRRPAGAEPGAPAWSVIDVSTGAVTPLDVDDDVSPVFAMSSDLTSAVLVDSTFSYLQYRLLDLADGSETDLDLSRSVDERVVAVSPALRTAVIQSGNAVSARFRVVELGTGETVLGPFQTTVEGFPVRASFVSETVVLIDNARPAGESPGPVASDDAFLIDLVGGATTRVDPGEGIGSVLAASPDGRRTIGQSTDFEGVWFFETGRPPQRLPGSYDAVATPDLSVIFSGGFVTCV